jgi:hypothetical protein
LAREVMASMRSAMRVTLLSRPLAAAAGVEGSLRSRPGENPPIRVER